MVPGPLLFALFLPALRGYMAALTVGMFLCGFLNGPIEVLLEDPYAPCRSVAASFRLSLHRLLGVSETLSNLRRTYFGPICVNRIAV